jgi:hypothetical protein
MKKKKKGAAEGFDLEEAAAAAAVLGHGPVVGTGGVVVGDSDAADVEVKVPVKMKMTMPAKKKTKCVWDGEDDHLLSTPRQTGNLWSFDAWAGGGVRAASLRSKKMMMMVVAMDSCGVDEGGGARWRSSWWAGWVEARISSRPLFFALNVGVAARGAWGLAGVCGWIVVRWTRLVGLWRCLGWGCRVSWSLWS